MSKFEDLPETRRRGLETMEEVYGFEMSDGTGDFFRYTADHLFADIWNRPGLSTRDRRLLLIGMLAGKGYADVLGIQVPAATEPSTITPSTSGRSWTRATKAAMLSSWCCMINRNRA